MRVAIIGPGLIGHSIALALGRADPDVNILEIDRGHALVAARGADVIVLATPVDVILDIINNQPDYLRAPLVIDTGSTKRAIVAAAREARLDTFVGGHPMAGAATSGAGGARADLFDGRPWFLVPPQPSAALVDAARTFVAALGAQPVVMEDGGEAHDRAMAAVSHLPQVVASALMIAAADAAGADLQWAGAGLRDTTRLAAGDARVWQSILVTNADQLRPLIRSMARSLDEFADALGDGYSVTRLLEAGQRARALL